MKKKWVEPRIEVQKFVPQEYCYVCANGWIIACDWSAANEVEKTMDYTGSEGSFDSNYAGNVIHGQNQCGSYDKQMLVDTDGNHTPDEM